MKHTDKTGSSSLGKYWKQTTNKETLRISEKSDGGSVPLDALEGAAGHVHDAACRPGHHAYQTFPDALKETCCALLLRPCRHISYQHQVHSDNLLLRFYCNLIGECFSFFS